MRTPPERLRVLLVDDHPLFRDGVAELLAIEDDLEVVGRAGDSVVAVRTAKQTNPHIVLLDVEMPYHPVRVTMAAIRQAASRARILILTMHDEPRLFQEVLSAGAHGVLIKTATREELVGAIRAVAYQGKTVLSVSRNCAAELAGRTHASPLSAREVQVLGLAARAMSNAQIAAELFIAEGTVKRHLTNVYAKLGAGSRLDAVNRARAWGLIQTIDDPWEAAGLPLTP
jgi:DNA-binding NarL/FixJ family response regulator